LQFKESTQTFTFDNLKADVVPSILRDFSAPVKLVPKEGTMTSEELEEELAFLAAYDTDGFNKWEAGQKLYTRMIFNKMDSVENEATWKRVLKAFGETLEQTVTDDYSIKAYALTLPSESSLAEDLGSKPVDPVLIHKSRGSVKKALARHFEEEIRKQYEELTALMAKDDEFKVDATSVGRRRLRNILMDFICTIKESPEELEQASTLAWKHYTDATGMTDKMAALSSLASMDGAELQSKALQTFYDDADGDALVLNKWFMVQALADGPDILNKVKALTKHPDFTLSNPNRCRALLSAFTMNAAGFHAADGEGYSFIADMIGKIDELNPQISSRMASSLISWKKYTPERGAKMKEQLEKLSKSKLSPDLFEIVNRGLK
jgi:aminopeptidase N